MVEDASNQLKVFSLFHEGIRLIPLHPVVRSVALPEIRRSDFEIEGVVEINLCSNNQTIVFRWKWSVDWELHYYRNCNGQESECFSRMVVFFLCSFDADWN